MVSILFGMVDMEAPTRARASGDSPQRTMSRQEWLEVALEVVSREGGAKLRIESLVRQVGVTKGSFYWHFKNRKEFIRSLIHYWDERYTLSVSDQLDEMEGSPEQKLRFLMEMVVVERLTRYDLAIRSWAVANPELQPLVKRSDEHRLNYLRKLFLGIGFDRDGADLRSRVFLGETAWEAARFEKMSKPRQRKHAMEFCDLLIAGSDSFSKTTKVNAAEISNSN